MHTAKKILIVTEEPLERYINLYINAKVKNRGFPILASLEVNITFQMLLWNDQN